MRITLRCIEAPKWRTVTRPWWFLPDFRVVPHVSCLKGEPLCRPVRSGIAAARRDGDVGFNRRTLALVGSIRGCGECNRLVRVRKQRTITIHPSESETREYHSHAHGRQRTGLGINLGAADAARHGITPAANAGRATHEANRLASLSILYVCIAQPWWAAPGAGDRRQRPGAD